MDGANFVGVGDDSNDFEVAEGDSNSVVVAAVVVNSYDFEAAADVDYALVAVGDPTCFETLYYLDLFQSRPCLCYVLHQSSFLLLLPSLKNRMERLRYIITVIFIT